MFPRLHVIFAALAEAGVRRIANGSGRRLLRGVIQQMNGDLRRVCQAQGKLIAMDFQLHGIAHGRKLHHADLGAGNEPHVEKMLAQRAFPAHRLNDGSLARLQILYCHSAIPLSHTAARGHFFPRAAVLFLFFVFIVSSIAASSNMAGAAEHKKRRAHCGALPGCFGKRNKWGSHLTAPFQSAGKRDLIRIFQIAAHGDAVGQARHLDGKGLEQP